ncbi:MAG: hypothetical protein E7365_06080 [Clostridiales bacterium]|nr:hypothetical protein [Clostridiales bacterium]
MREILFRGKRFSNGEWVIGGIMKTFHPNYDCGNEEEFLSQSPNCYCICANNKDYFVEQASIGQYTGLTDKNGTKIFEGDIVKVERDFWHGENKKEREIFIGVVCYDERSADFGLKGAKYMNLTMHRFKGDYQTVIGNIHDNPELLGGGEE